MGVCRNIRFLILSISIYGVFALPTSMVDEIKAQELRPNKVKRVSPPIQNAEENLKSSNHFYGNPTAIKRGSVSKSEDTSNDSDWSPEEQNIFQNEDLQSTFYNDGNLHDDKMINNYDKGFRYGVNKDKLDEALENAVLKSELYGAPSNQYRYLENDKRKRRKRDSKKFSYGNPVSSNDLTPEEIYSLLELYENERQNYQRPTENLDDFEQSDNDLWLDIPVRSRPELSNSQNLEQNYMLGQNPSKWNDNTEKHFMAARKRNDPTREIKYLTGPSKHDYYTLSQLLNNQRETNVPIFHRYVL